MPARKFTFDVLQLEKLDKSLTILLRFVTLFLDSLVDVSYNSPTALIIDISKRTKWLSLVTLLLVVLPMFAGFLFANGKLGQVQSETLSFVGLVIRLLLLLGFISATGALVSLCFDSAAGHKL